MEAEAPNLPAPVVIGYFAKRRTPRVDWLAAPQVREICSVSACIAEAPDGWIDRWTHNHLWVYDTPERARDVVSAAQREHFDLFAYRLVPLLFRDGRTEPLELPPTAPSPIPEGFEALGFDAVSRSAGTSFECSPLSCCNLAGAHGANEWCLFDSSERAAAAAAEWSRGGAEPGPYVVIEVLRQRAAGLPATPPAAEA
ncbi:MAG: hypothetical protein AB7O28_01555 [Vicinamibacterales bacterium]